MHTMSILCGVIIGVLGFINFCIRRIHKSQENKRMTAIGTILVIVCFVSALFLIILGLLLD